MTFSRSQFSIHKVSATGNDFLLVDLLSEDNRRLWQAEWGMHKRAELVRLWCDRHEGLGADGFVVLEPDTQADFKWDFYNSDGGHAEMCGNAARAVSLYASRALAKNELRFNTVAGLVTARIESADKIEVELPAVAESEWSQTAASQLAYDFVRAGVPHAVVQAPSIQDREALRAWARMIKAEPRFRAKGVNVTFVHLLAPQRLESVTFERGVEDFTLACGTGAIAAAYAQTRGRENQEIEVQVPGGRLAVVWKNGRPRLSGPAKIVAEMRVMRATE